MAGFTVDRGLKLGAILDPLWIKATLWLAGVTLHTGFIKAPAVVSPMAGVLRGQRRRATENRALSRVPPALLIDLPIARQDLQPSPLIPVQVALMPRNAQDQIHREDLLLSLFS